MFSRLARLSMSSTRPVVLPSLRPRYRPSFAAPFSTQPAGDKKAGASKLGDPLAKKIPHRPSLEAVKHIVVVSSAKGGVGKSTVAVNLAIALNQLRQKVALLDADIYGPSLPILMNLQKQTPEINRRKMLNPMMSYGIKCMSMGFLIPEDSAAVWRGPMVVLFVMGALEQLLKQTEWDEVDVMVVDLPPGTGDIQLSMAQTVPVSGAVIVCTPQDLALLDAIRGINMFRKVDIPVIGIVENMSYHTCEKCGTKSHIFGKEGARKTAAKLNVPFLGEIPLHQSIRETSDRGTPITVSEPQSEYAAVFRSLAQKVLDSLNDPSIAKKRKGPEITVE